MKTRRQFIQATGSALLVASSPALSSPRQEEQAGRPVRVGIIGAENSHAVGFGRTFNRDRKFPGVEVVGIWGETEEFAKSAAERGQIPWIVEDPAEFFGKIDALIVDHRHPQYHLDAARPFVEAGIPTFVDKPFCYRLAQGKEFLAMARAKGTPVTSFSTVARGAGIRDMREQAAGMRNIHHVLSAGHCDINSPYGGVFFYGVHQVQRVMEIFGEEISAVRVSRSGEDASAVLRFPSGPQVTMLLSKGRPRFSFAVVTDEGVRPLEPRVETDPLTPYREIVDLFREGKIARAHESLLKETAVLEALERSVASDRWEEI